MRMNLPVTNVEYPIDDDTLIVSKTDTKGTITFANDDFVKVSGFALEELIGQPHNIVRHPDMPSEAFDDLWATLKSGKPWAGAVKNRRKNGDYYWVLASASPVWENGEITGYMSVRTKLPADQRQEAERVYGLIREKKAHGYRLESGVLRRRSWADHFSLFTSTLKARLVTLSTVLAGFMLLIGLTGLLAAYQVNQQLQSVYNDRVVGLAQLFEINNRMQENILTLYGAAADGQVGRSIGRAAERVTENIDVITKLWAQFTAHALTSEAKGVAESFVAKRRDYVEIGLKPGVSLLKENRFDELAQHVTETVSPLFAAAKKEAEKLVVLEDASAKAEYEGAQRNYMLTLAIAVTALVSGVGLGGWLAMATIRAIIRPTNRMIEVMGKIAQGQLNNRIIVERDDEIGVALRHLQAMQAKLCFDREVRREEEERRHSRALRVETLVRAFDRDVAGVLEAVASQASGLELTAKSMSQISEQTSQQAAAVAAVSQQTSANVQSVAASTEEMSASIGEISRQVQESSRIASEAVEQAEAADARVSALSKAADRIGDVVKLITTIAEQTNLLALNATIEAARAGEAGKGFAVVAQEVKQLASQTARATGEISEQISSIQAATRDSVHAIKSVGATIARISEIASAIAAAVEEQGAATTEIAGNVQQAAQGTAQVTANIASVKEAAQHTGAAASEVLVAAAELSKSGEQLRRQVEDFLRQVRAA